MNANNADTAEADLKKEADKPGVFTVPNIFTMLRVPLTILSLLTFEYSNEGTRGLYSLLLFAAIAVVGVRAFPAKGWYIAPLFCVTAIALPVAVFANTEDYQLTAVVMIMCAAWTDFFDGLIARQLEQESDLGRLLDPVADKTLMLLTLLYAIFAYLPRAEPGFVSWAVAILATEVIIFLYSSYVLVSRGEELRVNWFGKKGMFGRMTGITWILISTLGTSQFFDVAVVIAYVATAAGVAFGLIALVQYFAQARLMPQKA